MPPPLMPPPLMPPPLPAAACRLRDDDRKDKDVIAHLNNENSYTRAVMADTEALQVGRRRGRVAVGLCVGNSCIGTQQQARRPLGCFWAHSLFAFTGCCCRVAAPACVDRPGRDACAPLRVLLQEKLYLEMRARIKEEDQQVPGRCGIGPVWRGVRPCFYGRGLGGEGWGGGQCRKRQH